MNVFANTVVTLTYKLFDTDGELIEQSDEPVSYLHGGFSAIFPKVEEALATKQVGETASVVLDPDDAFGEYDSELVRVEAQDRFPADVEVGMQFEGLPAGEDDSAHTLVYTVTDIADGKVVVDGNHPLAGLRLRFDCTIVDVRPATSEEIEHGHVHGPHAHHHH
jgi:FKBP-type peptidyl-prolyl cis-trans isomerase SlyD